jgi:hypothetical protein
MECSKLQINVGLRNIGLFFFLTLSFLLLSGITFATVSEESRTNVFGYRNWNYTTTKADKVDFCNLFESRSYDSKQIVTTAILYIPASGEPRVDGGDESFFYSIDCNNNDNFALADFSNTQSINFKKQFFGNTNFPQIYQTTFTALFQIELFPSVGHLSWLRANLKVTEIHSANRLGAGIKFPDFDAESPILNKGSKLRDLNNHLLFSYFSREEVGIKNPLTPETRITVDGRGLKPTKFAYTGQVGKVGLQTHSLKQEGSFWVIRGTITNEVQKETSIQMEFECKYIWSDTKGWKLYLLKITTISEMKRDYTVSDDRDNFQWARPGDRYREDR